MLAMLYTFLCHIFFLAGYLVNPNSFPRALTPEEERRYLEEFHNGDESKKNLLIEHNLRLVAHVVKKYVSSGKEMDDLISIGTIGLIKAVNSFHYEKGSRLATYAARCIENEVLMVLRAEKKLQNEISLYEPIKGGRGEGDMTFLEILETDDEAAFEEAELKNEIKRLHGVIDQVLTDREKIVIQMRYGLRDGKEHTQREIAKGLGLSRSYVSRIEKKAIKKLNAEMAEDPYFER